MTNQHRSACFFQVTDDRTPMCIGIGFGSSELTVSPEKPDPAAFQYGIMADAKGMVLIKDSESISCANRALGKWVCFS